MFFYNNINTNIINKTYIPIYEWYETKGETRLESATNWSRGYMLGTMIASEEFSTEEFSYLFLPILALTGIIPKARLKKDNLTPEEVIETIPLVVKEIYTFYHESKEELLFRKYNTLEPIVNNNKIGRNELCLCGSGKKYKKCCLKN